MNTAKIDLKNILFLIIILQLLTSCGAKKNLVEEKANDELSSKNIINNHYKNQLHFKTISGRLKIDYDDGVSSKSFTMSLRMEKDKTIWLSAPLNMAKMLITPDRVSFYNKLDNTYFDGDFSYLTDLLGTELSFEKVQNLLLGQAIFDLKEEPYKTDIIANNYQLKPEKDIPLFKKLILLNPSHYKVALQQVSQPESKRWLNINYNSYQEIEHQIFPDEIVITAEEETFKTKIELAYKNIEFNKEVSFPYDIPEGFKEITITK